MKKKSFWKDLANRPSKVIAYFLLLGMIGSGVAFIWFIPARVATAEQNIYDMQEYINEQRIANKLMQEIQQYNNQRQQQPEYPPPPRECWDYGEDGYQYEVDCLTGNWL